MAGFLGIFFRLLIKTVDVVLLFEGMGLGDDSRLTLALEGDLLTAVVVVGSTLMGSLGVGLLPGMAAGFFNGS